MKTKHQKIPLGIFLVFTLAIASVANETVCTERINPIFWPLGQLQWAVDHSARPRSEMDWKPLRFHR